MAKNKTVGDFQRKGAVRTRSQIKNPISGRWTKRDDKSGKFMDVKVDAKPFKGVRKEKALSRKDSSKLALAERINTHLPRFTRTVQAIAGNGRLEWHEDLRLAVELLSEASARLTLKDNP